MKYSQDKIKESKCFLNIHKKLEQAISDYNMINDNDHVIVGLSGGKDSTLLLKLLVRKKISTTNNFKISAVFVKMGFDTDNEKIEYLSEFSKTQKVPFYILEKDIQSTFAREKKSPCYLCSRDRRLSIFDLCDKINGNVVAFGHHKNDFIETLILNIFYGGCIQTMKPVNHFFNGKYRIIRPMLYVDEQQIISEIETQQIRVFPQGCSFSDASERKYVKEIINCIYKHYPESRKNLFKAMYSADTDYLLKKPGRNL